MPERRHLPVLKPPGPPPQRDDDDTRPPWHWIGLGTLTIFAVWLPLAYAAQAVLARVVEREFGHDMPPETIAAKLAASSSADRLRLTAILAVPHALAFAVASFVGGFVVGRFGARAGVREAALSGAVTAFFAIVIAWETSFGYLFTAVIILSIGIVFAAWGGRVGARKRPGPDRPAC
ncbi:MAG: hypothetical protein FWD69_04980 [Polyangiaceae bacterium]|nr:hypothetical protein [Polyangiaceae bacterium]